MFNAIPWIEWKISLFIKHVYINLCFKIHFIRPLSTGIHKYQNELHCDYMKLRQTETHVNR